MQVSSECEVSDRMQYQMPTLFFEWQLQPPPVEATVYAIGYPRLAVKPSDGRLIIDAPFTFQELTVTAIHLMRRDEGMLNFPCFEVSHSLAHGFSGGPVFFEGRLCGIVSSGSSFDTRGFVASLWPLTLMSTAMNSHERTSGIFWIEM